MCPRQSVFNIFNHKSFFRRIWFTTFCKNVFIFQYFHMITNFKYNMFPIIFFVEVNKCVWFYINRLLFYCVMTVLLDLLTVSCNLLIHKLFDTEVIYLQILFFKVLTNFSAATDFPSLCLEYISISLSCNHDFSLIYCKVCNFYLPIIFWFATWFI